MGCKHELPQCRNGDSSRAASAFVQFAVVINGAVRIFFYVWFKVTALKLLGQLCLMWRDTCMKPGLFGGGSAFSSPIVVPPQPLRHRSKALPRSWTSGSSLPCTANLPREFLREIITWHSIRATSSRLLIRGTQAQVFACCFKRLPPLPPPPPSLLPAFFLLYLH